MHRQVQAVEPRILIRSPLFCATADTGSCLASCPCPTLVGRNAQSDFRVDYKGMDWMDYTNFGVETFGMKSNVASPSAQS